MELPPHPPVSKEVHDTLEETINQLSSSTGIEDPNYRNPRGVFDEYGEKDSGIKGLDPRWYAKTPYMQTPYGAQGICKHSEFLDKHEHEMSSPSRRLSNAKFRKGAQVEANLGALVRNQLELNDKESPWGSKSPFVHEEDHNRHVKPDRGGRMISSGDGLRLIKAKNDKMEETAMEKLRNELLGAQMRLEREEKRAHEKEQKEAEKRRKAAEKEADRVRKAEEKAKKDEEKRLKQVALEERQQALVAQGKKPRGRRPKGASSQSQDIEETKVGLADTY
jgi:hypothetical protein